MTQKIHTITIKPEEVKTDHTASGRLIDKIAMSIGSWTEEDLFENNIDYQSEGFDYIIEHFDFENAFLEYLNKMTDYEANRYIDFNITPRPSEQKLKFGAYMALNLPDFFKEKLEEFTQELKDEMYQYQDSEMFDKKAPELKKELEEAEASFWKNLQHEWLYGDRSEAGLIETYRKFIGAEEVNYNEKKDTITITIDAEAIDQYSDETPTKAEAKQILIREIEDGMTNTHEKQKAQAEKRKIEWEETKKRKEASKKQDEEERKAKLSAMIK